MGSHSEPGETASGDQHSRGVRRHRAAEPATPGGEGVIIDRVRQHGQGQQPEANESDSGAKDVTRITGAGTVAEAEAVMDSVLAFVNGRAGDLGVQTAADAILEDVA